MSDEVLLSRGAVGTVGAREGLLPSMCAVVPGKEVWPLKDMATHLTGICFATTAVG